MERMHSEHFTTMPVSAMEHRHRYAFARAYSRGSVLDIACGIGYGSEFLCGNGAAQRYHGVDYDAGAIDEAVAKYGSETRTFLVGDILNLEFPSGAFDAAFSFETLEHIRDPGLALQELKRVLKPGGVLVGSVPDGAFDSVMAAVAGENEFHLHRFSRAQLEGLLREHFTNVQIGYAEVVIASRISLLDAPAAAKVPSNELTDKMKSTHGSFYFVCSDGSLPPFAENLGGYLPFFEENTRWAGWFRHQQRTIDELQVELAAGQRAAPIQTAAPAMRVAVYTAIFGNYDDLKPPVPQDIECDFFCFTDNRAMWRRRRVGAWEIVPIRRDPAVHPRMQAKWFKILCHAVFPHGRLRRNFALRAGRILNRRTYDCAIWIDGSLRVKGASMAREISRLTRDGSLAVYGHPDRDCIYQEASASLSYKKYDGLPLEEQVEQYRMAGTPEHCGLYACTLIARKLPLDDQQISFDEAWWQENQRWTYQDQLSFAHLVHQRRMQLEVIPGHLWNNDYFDWVEHKSDI